MTRAEALYFVQFPEGRERQRWPGLIYVRVRPRAIRYSAFTGEPSEIVELAARQRQGGD